MSSMHKFIKQNIEEFDKKTITVYLTLRLLVFIVMIIQILHGNWEAVFLCFLTLVLFLIPFFIDKKWNIDLPTPLEIVILLFIFAAEILGEIQNFYGIFPYWDLLLHTLNGFLCAAIGFSLIDILNEHKKKHFRLSPFYLTLVAFCFSMTIGVLWEFFEYGVDKIMRYDMQKDQIVENISSVLLNPEGENIPVDIDHIENTTIYYNDKGTIKEYTIDGYLDIGLNDTMEDLFVNFVGAMTFSIFGYLYVKNREKYKLVEGFIPTSKRKKEEKRKVEKTK